MLTASNLLNPSFAGRYAREGEKNTGHVDVLYGTRGGAVRSFVLLILRYWQSRDMFLGTA